MPPAPLQVFQDMADSRLTHFDNPPIGRMLVLQPWG